MLLFKLLITNVTITVAFPIGLYVILLGTYCESLHWISFFFSPLRILEMLSQFSEWFWNPDIWLPKDFAWQDYRNYTVTNYPVWEHLWTYPFAMAVLAMMLRFLILNKLVYRPIALLLGFKDFKPRPVTPNPLLESLFRRYKNKVPNEELIACSKKLDWSQRKVERWFRHRLVMTKVSKQVKFMECAWQLTYYTAIFSYGLYIMLDKPWLYDLKKCWYDYPHHDMENDVWWYYMISLSFYWSMIFTHFFETKRKDFWQMFFHHLVTIALIAFSWTCNFTRVGTLVLILHDCADIPLQLAKICIYLGYQALCDAVFALFAVTWVITRDCLFPLFIIRNTLFDAIHIIPIFPVYYIFNSLLITLFVLHLYWTYFIFKIIVTTVAKGKMEDERSSSDEINEEEIAKIENSSESPMEVDNNTATEIIQNGINGNSKNHILREINGVCGT